MDSDLVICIIIVVFSLIFGLMYIIFPTKIREHNTLYYNRKRNKEENAAASADRLGNKDSGSVDYRSRNFDFTCVYESALISIIFHHKNKK